MLDQSFVWPEGIPRDFDELVREYGHYIEQQVAKYNRQGWEQQLSDLRQHIWEKLITSNLLEKFVTRANTTLPPLMTGLQAREYLGIKGSNWRYFMWKADLPDDWQGKYQKRKRLNWLPRPIKGKKNSDSALFRGIDVKLLDESGLIKKRHFPSKRPPVLGRGFKSYLQRAIRNHWANWCRSHTRRHKERPLSPEIILTQNDDGMFRPTSRIEGGGSWESTMVVASFSDEGVHDLRQFRHDCKMARFDLSCMTTVTKKGVPTKQARKGLEVLDIVSQGYSIKEAIRKQQKAELRARMKQQQTV